MPLKPYPTTRFERFKSQTRRYDRLPDELYNDVVLCASPVSQRFEILFPKRSKYVFVVICKKPVNSDIFKWEEINKPKRAPWFDRLDRKEPSNNTGKLYKERLKMQKRRRELNAKKKL